jgi:hypothetical protein
MRAYPWYSLVAQVCQSLSQLLMEHFVAAVQQLILLGGGGLWSLPARHTVEGTA